MDHFTKSIAWLTSHANTISHRARTLRDSYAEKHESESGAAPAPPPQRLAGGIKTPFGVIDPGRQISPPPARRRGEIRRNGNDLTSTGVTPLKSISKVLKSP